jgi:hypothetical protein
VWLNYSFLLVFGRALRRSVGRSLDKTLLFAGNRESLRLTLFSRHSILLWVLRTFWARRREYPAVLADPRHAHLTQLEFRRPNEAERWLTEIAADADQPRESFSNVAEAQSGLIN